jgi:hypothetical protein
MRKVQRFQGTRRAEGSGPQKVVSLFKKVALNHIKSPLGIVSLLSDSMTCLQNLLIQPVIIERRVRSAGDVA